MRFSLYTSLLLLSSQSMALEVNISPDMESVNINHNDKEVTIQRQQDTKNTINPDYAKTSRPCPPFCIQPMTLAPGVETIGELELLKYLDKKNWGDDNIVVIDSRTSDWVAKGTIPGAINIPWTSLRLDKGTDTFEIKSIFVDQFGVQEQESIWDFEKAKTLVMFCNGAWCGQSPTNIRTLLRLGYPADKIKWYRGGMQAWETFGLTTAQ